MKKRVLLVIGLYLCSMTVLAAAKDMSWSGWVSDSKCGAKGANADHAACAKKCIDSRRETGVGDRQGPKGGCD